MAEKEVRTVKMDEIIEFSVDYIVITVTGSGGNETRKYDGKKVVCKSLDDARRKANDRSRNPSNSLTASVHIKIPVEKKKLFSKDTKVVDSWMLLEKYVDGRLKEKSKKVALIEEDTKSFDMWS